MTKLQLNVIEQLGYDELNDECLSVLKDVANYGAYVGFCGFTYYNDTVKFYENNKAFIIQDIENMANELNTEVFEMIANFNCLKDFNLSSVEIYKIVYNSDNEHELSTQVKNALSWYALEETAHLLIK